MEKAPIRGGKKQEVALERRGGMRECDSKGPHHLTQLSQLVSHIGVLLATYI
jgi:hypothetical protein